MTREYYQEHRAEIIKRVRANYLKRCALDPNHKKLTQLRKDLHRLRESKQRLEEHVEHLCRRIIHIAVEIRKMERTSDSRTIR